MTTKRRFIAPEVVQSSGMDCGPAALKSFLEGHFLSVSYGRLREACQTDVDGTAIETLENLASGLGVPVEQVLLPKDVVLLEEAQALPSIAVLRLPNGNTHFAVLWNRIGGLYQVMDPASGRRWLTRASLLQELYEHVMTVPASDWRAWAGSEEGLALVRKVLLALGLSGDEAEALLREAAADEGWLSLAALDAAARGARALVAEGELRRGEEARVLVRSLFDLGRSDPNTLPQGFWSVRSASEDALEVRGAVVVRPTEEPVEAPPLPPSVAAARDEAPLRPGRELLGWILRDGLAAPSVLVVAFFAAASAIVVEALLFRALLELAPLFGLTEYRVGVLVLLLAFMLVVAGIDWAAIAGELRLGRRLETRLRLAFQRKLPKLGDRYFASRLTADMAERQHHLHALRTLPRLAGRMARFGFELLLTAAAIVWLEPSTAPVVLLTAAASIGLPLVGQPVLYERDLRVRSHLGGLSRFYLDALLGLVPLRVHGAERALRAEHESLLVQWARSRLALQRGAVAVEALSFFVGYGLIVALLISYLSGGGQPATILLLAYWALNLPVLGLAMVRLAWQYPELRNALVRVTEPLRALEESHAAPRSGAAVEAPRSGAKGVTLRLEGVSVRRGGRAILEGLDLDVPAASHVAIVGRSGAGKTSLFGLLLGWHFPAEGRVLLDGALLSGERLAEARREIAWVDPAVQIWNRSVLDNLRYGNADGSAAAPLATVVERAELLPVLEALPEGHQTRLGEGGGLVSGGEGQRVRLARAFLRPHVRLVLLDEPFRGLDRRHRRELLQRARELWREQTLFCITHDVSETEGFDRVLVVEEGRIVEDDAPAALAGRTGSLYRHLLDSERQLLALWEDGSWRRWAIDNGRLRDDAL